MRAFFAGGAVAALLSLCAAAQDEEPLPMESGLRQLWELRERPLDQLRARWSSDSLALDERARAHVEIVGPSGSPGVPDAFVEELGGYVEGRWRHRVDAWLPIDRLVPAARALPPGHTLLRAQIGVPDDGPEDDGPCEMGSDAYRDGGADGSGLRIAVIDTDWSGLSAAQSAGAAPASPTIVNYTGNPFQGGTSTHGTRCLETVFEHAPGAEYTLFRIDSAADLGNAVDDCIDGGVDVISHSLSWFNTGWDDDSGDPCAAAEDAAEAGILFFTSAGNRHGEHRQDVLDPDANDLHQWSPGVVDLSVIVPANTTVSFRLQWDTSGLDVDDLDLLILQGGAVVASSTSDFQIFEVAQVVNSSGLPAVVSARVRHESGNVGSFELFAVNGAVGAPSASGSTTSPSNTTHENVISVGAVFVTDYGSPAGASGIIAGYSGRGPSNSGMRLPDLVGPTNTSTSAGSFGGTSCATPNVAGMAAALWSSQPPWIAGAVSDLLMAQAEAFKDWGGIGPGNTFGAGGAVLASWAPDTTWWAPVAGNTSNSSTEPYYDFDVALDETDPGGRLLAFSIDGLTVPGAQTIDLPANSDVRIVAAGGAVILGGP